MRAGMLFPKAINLAKQLEHIELKSFPWLDQDDY